MSFTGTPIHLNISPIFDRALDSAAACQDGAPAVVREQLVGVPAQELLLAGAATFTDALWLRLVAMEVPLCPSRNWGTSIAAESLKRLCWEIIFCFFFVVDSP